MSIEICLHLRGNCVVGKQNHDKEIQRRIMAGWAACSKVPESLQKQPCHLHEETDVQLLRASSYDVWYRALDTRQS